MKTKVVLTTVLFTLLVILIRCEDLFVDEDLSETNDYKFTGVILGKSNNCNNLHIIKLLNDRSEIYKITGSYNSIYAAEGLPDSLKKDSIFVQLNFRKSGNTGSSTCAFKENSYQSIRITKASIYTNTNKITYLDKIFGGCFTKNPSDLKTTNLGKDTIYYSVNEDTLDLHVNLNYNCCGKLTDSIYIGPENISIFIKDTCSGYYCECNCSCDFEFKYHFENFEAKKLNFKVFLNGFRDNDYNQILEKTFVDGMD